MTPQPAPKFEALLSHLSSQKIDFSKTVDHAVFRDKSVLVTGGSGGIGSAIVRMFAEAGAYVVIADMDEQRGPKLEGEIKAQYGEERVKYIRTDIRSWTAQVAMFRSALSFLPSRAFDIVVICAGLNPVIPDIVPEDPASFFNDDVVPEPPNTACLDVGIQGTIYTVQLATKYGMGLYPANESPSKGLSTTFSKSITIFGSLWGNTDCPVGIDYATTKWGLRGLVRALRSPLKQKAGVRVNLVAPAWMRTPMTEGIVEEVEAVGWRFGRLEDVREAVARLAGNASVNGRSIYVGPNGLVDLCDDFAGMDGALQILSTCQRGELLVLDSFFH